ncbi:MAG: ABC transporter substrate-binding protein [Alphaproteobacteria bacterium]
MKLLSRLTGCIVGVAVAAIAGTASGQQMRDVAIGLSSGSLIPAPARLAKEMGLYEKRGLNARIVMMDSGNAATAALIAGSLNFIVVGPGEQVAAQARGLKIVTVTSVYSGFSALMVLSKATVDKLGVSPTAPVSERLKALSGLLIASPSATSTYTIGPAGAAKSVGADVRFTYMAQPAMIAALETGAIQGYVSSSPFWAPPVLKGSAVLWLNGPKGDFPADNATAHASTLQTTQAFGEANRDLVKTVITVFDDFVKALDDRPADVKAAIAKIYPDLDAQTLELLYTTESQGWKAKPVTADDMAREIAFVKAAGSVKLPLDNVDPAAMIFK